VEYVDILFTWTCFIFETRDVRFDDLISAVSWDLPYSRKEYVQALANALQQKLDDDIEKRIVIIGCGEWEPIKTYTRMYSLSVCLYQDWLKCRENGIQRCHIRRSYAQCLSCSWHEYREACYHSSEWKEAQLHSWKCIQHYIVKHMGAHHLFGFLYHRTDWAWQNGPISNPRLIGKQGNISQLGGEFILGPGKHRLLIFLFNSCLFRLHMFFCFKNATHRRPYVCVF